MVDKKVSHDFILNQMTLIKGDVGYYIEQIESNERFALISTASIWVFVASQHWNNALSIVIWIPTIIVLFLAVKRILLAKTIHAKTEYLKDVESKLGLEEFGWNTFWSQHKYGKWAGNKSYLKWWGRFFWTSLLIGNSLIAFFVPFQDILK